jgi:peptidase A4-like protein
MFRRWCIPLAGLALVIGSIAASAPAAAAGRAPAGHPIRPTVHLIRPGPPMIGHGFRGNAQQSSNWSGYAALNGSFHRASANWSEPTGHCTAGSRYSSFWVGLDGDGSKNVEQTGTEVDCIGGSPRYYAWYELYPANAVNFSNPVSPGDHFRGLVSFNGGNSYTLVLRDITKGWSHTIHASRSAPNASAEAIAEAPSSGSSILPLADFGTVHFHSVRVDGSAIGDHSPTQIIMIDASSHQMDTVSPLSGGENFSVTWKRAR